MPEAQFLEARKAFHAALLEATLTTNAAGVVSNADSSNTTSKAIAKGIADLLKAETIGERIAGQTSGNQFEGICAGFVRETFLKLGHLRPGIWDVHQVSAASACGFGCGQPRSDELTPAPGKRWCGRSGVKMTRSWLPIRRKTSWTA